MHQDPMTAALAWAERGFRVFPTQAKAPLTHGRDWRSLAASDLFAISMMPWEGADGYGVALDDHVVIDLDQPIGLARRNLEALADDLPETLTVRTPSGGFHYYFVYNREEALSQRSPAEHVDVRLPGKGYVCGPGTGGYEIVDDRPAAPLPSSLAARLAPAKPEATHTAEPACPLDTPASIAAVKALLRGHLHNTDGPEDEFRYVLACRVRERGVSEEVALDAMTQWNAHCDHPRDQAEIEKAVRNAYKFGQNAPGERVAPLVSLIDYDAEPPAPEPEEEPEALLEWVPLTDEPPPPQAYVIPEFIPDGTLTSIYGAGSAGKTQLALQMGLCVASGAPFLGRRVKQGPVLLFLSEDTRLEVQRRLYYLSRKMGLTSADLADLHVARPLNDAALFVGGREARGSFTALHDAIRTQAAALGARLVVLDNAAAIFGGTEIDRGQVSQFLRELARSAAECDAAWVLLGHPPKVNGGAVNGNRISGSTAWRNGPRAILWLDREATHTEISTEKANVSGMLAEPLQMYWDAGMFTVDENSEGAQRQKQAEGKAQELLERRLVALYHQGKMYSATIAGTGGMAQYLVQNFPQDGKSWSDWNKAIKQGVRDGWLRPNVQKPRNLKSKVKSPVVGFPTKYTKEDKAGYIVVDPETIPAVAEIDDGTDPSTANLYGDLS